jgi:hypothetical protein
MKPSCYSPPYKGRTYVTPVTFLGEPMNWGKGGIVFFFAVMIAVWLAAAWFFLFGPPGASFWPSF